MNNETIETSLADRVRQIEIQISELRQSTVVYGTGPSTAYRELLDASSLLLNAAGYLRDWER